MLQTLRQITGLPLRFEDLLFLRNVGSARDSSKRFDHISSRGFNLLLLTTEGTPAYFAKCRSIDNARHQREAKILQVLQESAELADLVPKARVAEADHVRAIVMDYLPGQDLEFFLHRQNWAFRIKCFTKVLETAQTAIEVVQRAAVIQRPAEAPYALTAAYEPVLEEVGKQGRVQLQAALDRVADMNPMLQHGDLTARNVRVVDGRLILLDFEALGDSELPLADSWNLIRNLPRTGRWASSRPDWWNGPASIVVRLQGERLGFSQSEMRALLVVFLWKSALTLFERGVDWRGYTNELRAVLAEKRAFGTRAP